MTNKAAKRPVTKPMPRDFEAEALKICEDARGGRLPYVPLQADHLVKLQDFYRNLMNTANLRGLCVEGNHP